MSNVIMIFFVVAYDFVIRCDLINNSQQLFLYALNALCQVILFVLMRYSLDFIAHRNLKRILVLFSVVLISIPTIVEYVFFSVYHRFFQQNELEIVFENFFFFVTCANSMISQQSVLYHMVYPLFLYAYFMGVIDRWVDANAVRLSDRFKCFKKMKKRTVFFLILLNVGCWHEVRKYRAHSLAFPVYSMLLHIQIYLREYSKKQLPTAYTSESRLRNLDVIPTFERRGNFNVLFIINESLRADHTSYSGYGRDTTPFQNRWLADQGYVFRRAYSNSGTTSRSLASIFSGLNANPAEFEPTTSLIWQYFKQAGYRNYYIGSHWLKWDGDFGEAFLDNRFMDAVNGSEEADASIGRSDLVSFGELEKILTENSLKTDPFFAVLHLNNTHYPYHSYGHESWRPFSLIFDVRKIADSINSYDNAILSTDAVIERAFDLLSEMGEADNTIVVSTSDHGEGFMEHQQFFHGLLFWDEGVKIPMYIKIPERVRPHFTAQELENLALKQREVVSNVDLFPTFVNLVGAKSDKNFHGESLFLKPKRRVVRIEHDYTFALIDSLTGDKLYYSSDQSTISHSNIFTDEREEKIIRLKLMNNPDPNDIEKTILLNSTPMSINDLMLEICKKTDSVSFNNCKIETN